MRSGTRNAQTGALVTDFPWGAPMMLKTAASSMLGIEMIAQPDEVPVLELLRARAVSRRVIACRRRSRSCHRPPWLNRHGSAAKAVLLVAVSLVATLFTGNLAVAQLDFEAEPINYNSAPLSDPVQKLSARIENGETELEFDERFGYLKSVLSELGISDSSQMLVFSKTSFQLRRISPQRPRAVYFNDDVYVGWVQGGDVVEISAADPQQGAIFYTLSQQRSAKPTIRRDRGQCIVCHASSRTSDVPGHLVRSVYPSGSGQPFYGAGTYTTDHRSPFKERWGGWYVSGQHGQQRHMGNVIATGDDGAETLDSEQGANICDLTTLINTAPYLTPHSDIVALMVLEHQVRMHNLITRANFESRSAAYYDQVMNQAMERPADHQSESSQRRIVAAAENLVEYMLFGDEHPLTAKVAGTSEFAERFARLGPFDSHGRSLRQFDLETRMMKYPCSYLIYSEPFSQLPSDVKGHVYRQLGRVLTGTDTNVRFAHLSAADRTAILEILQETIPAFPRPS